MDTMYCVSYTLGCEARIIHCKKQKVKKNFQRNKHLQSFEFGD